MIVDTMSDEEIRLELKKDEAGVFAKMKAQLLKDKNSNFLNSFRSLPIRYTREVVSNNHNRYVALYYLDGKVNGRGKINLTTLEVFYLAVHFREGKGYYAYTWNAATNRLSKIMPHFFKRYAERQGVKGYSIDIIKHYLKNNRKGLGALAVYGKKQFTAFVLETGIALGILEGNVTIDLTFVSYDMLFDNQRAWHDMMLKNLRNRLQLDNDSLGAKERRQVWKDFIIGRAMDDDVYKEFWRLFARYHLKRDVEVTRGDLPEQKMKDVFVLVDKTYDDR